MLPGVFVVEAVITNTGSITATDVEVTLDYDDGSWVLVDGEDEVRIIDVAPYTSSYAYWLARYPNQPTDIGKSHQYTVTAEVPNTSLVATSTVQTRSSQSTGNTEVSQTSAEIVVGVAFTVTQVYTIGTNALDAVFSPVGNDDFDASAYRLIASEVHFYDEDLPPAGGPTTVADRLYFDTVPSWADTAEVVYTFLALLPANAYLCPYAAFDFNPGDNAKFDEGYCGENTRIPITGTLSLSQTKQVNSLTVEQGQLLTYTINYTNTGDKPLQYTWIWDDIPATLASIETDSITPTPAVTTESRVAWNLGTISPAGQDGSTGTLTFAVLVDGDGQDLEDGELLVNHAFFGISPGGLPKRAALTSTVTTTIQAPTIALSKTDGQETAQPDDLLTYTLRITNSSSSVATSGLVITDELPAGVTLDGTTSPGFDSQSPDGRTLVWNSLDVSADGTLEVTIPVRVNSDVPDGTTLTNTATVTYKNPSGQHTFAAETATDTTVVQAPVLSITKTAEDVNSGDLEVGDEILYTLQVTNTGSYPAYDVTVTDDLPDQVTCQAVSGDSAPAGCADPLAWSISSLAADATASLYITVTINDGSKGQTITNTASVTGSNVFDPPDDPTPVCPDGSTPVGGVCTTTPEPGDTELAITKTAEDVDGGDLVVGDEVLYTWQVTNTGSYIAYTVTVTDDLPDQVTCQAVSGDSAPSGCADPLVWSIPSLAVDDPASLYITVTINGGSEGQTITNTGSVTGENVPDPPDDPTPVCLDGSYPVGGVCPNTPVPTTTLSIAKTAEDVDGGDLMVGDEILYTLQVTNIGSYTAYTVTVTDDLPDQVTCQTVSGDSAPAGCADPLEWIVPSLAVDTTASLYITVTINPGSQGQTITNTASVTGTNVPDPPDDPTPVCPDGSTPVGGVCETTPEGSGGGIFLPIILKNN
jgi:uncharacterized repeat protein (TIGR01451 family)